MQMVGNRGGEGDGEAEKKKFFSCFTHLQNFVKIEIVKNPLKKTKKFWDREVGRKKREKI